MIIRYFFKYAAITLSLCILLFILTSCKSKSEDNTTEPPVLSTTQSTVSTEKETSKKSTADSSLSDKIDTYIVLDDSNSIINGNGASFENNILTITQSGTYSLEGTLSDGKILINSPDEAKKVKLVLNGVTVSCSTDAPLFIENSPKETILILKDGTTNTFSDTERDVPTDENADYATATVYSKDDLQIEGNGTLNIKGNFNKGIFSKNDIDIRGGDLNIESVDDGIRGKDSVEISAGEINITCGGDGIRTNETQQEEKGSIIINGGIITVSSELDCIQSVKDITVTGGTLNLTSGGGATESISATDREGNDFHMGGGNAGPPDRGNRGGKGGMFGIYGGGPRPEDSSAVESENEDTPSVKGIKADGIITINGSDTVISSADDCIHAPDIKISNGAFSLKSDDDGIHADNSLEISGGDIDITYSYEGIEGKAINISDGNIKIKSTDDGFNAAGDTVSNNPMQADLSCEINIRGGRIHIDADGDGIDSNGNVNQSGGTVTVFGPASGANGALDYGGKYTVSGGTLLALGSQGMAQSVTGDSLEVLAFTYSCKADVLNTITDSQGNALIGFKSPKSFGTVVYVSDKLKSGESCSVYSDGSYNSEGENGVWLKGDYTKGTLVGTLS